MKVTFDQNVIIGEGPDARFVPAGVEVDLPEGQAFDPTRPGYAFPRTLVEQKKETER